MIKPASTSRSGNILVYIIGAIFLMGILIVLLKGSFQEGTGTDAEQVMMKVSQVQQYAAEIERAVTYVLRNGTSESDIRFAYTGALAGYGVYADTSAMIFAPSGGAAEYKAPPSGINDGTAWQFFGTTHFTDLGTDGGSAKAELIAVLPKVTQDFCSRVNVVNGQNIDLTLTTDPAGNGCVYEVGSEFAGTFRTGGTINLLDDTKLTKLQAREACVRCSTGTFNYYRVLMIR